MNEDMIDQILGGWEKSTKELYRGVFDPKEFAAQVQNYLNPSKGNIFVINVTLGEKKFNGGHWVLVYFDGDPRKDINLFYFDSFSRKASAYSETFDETLTDLTSYSQNSLASSPYRVQGNTSQVCGIYCIFMALQLIKHQNILPEKRMSQIVRKYFSPRDYTANDLFVYK